MKFITLFILLCIALQAREIPRDNPIQGRLKIVNGASAECVMHKFNQYRARLFRLKSKTNNTIQISIYKIKNKGLKAFDEIKDRQLPPIQINAPRNSFEKGIVKAYSDCRKKKLNKYLPVLTDTEVAYLIKDNYIQKKDVKSLLQ